MWIWRSRFARVSCHCLVHCPTWHGCHLRRVPRRSSIPPIWHRHPPSRSLHLHHGYHLHQLHQMLLRRTSATLCHRQFLQLQSRHLHHHHRLLLFRRITAPKCQRQHLQLQSYHRQLLLRRISVTFRQRQHPHPHQQPASQSHPQHCLRGLLHRMHHYSQQGCHLYFCRVLAQGQWVVQHSSANSILGWKIN